MEDCEYLTVTLTIDRKKMTEIEALFCSWKWEMNMKVISDEDKLLLRTHNLTHILPDVSQAWFTAEEFRPESGERSDNDLENSLLAENKYTLLKASTKVTLDSAGLESHIRKPESNQNNLESKLSDTGALKLSTETQFQNTETKQQGIEDVKQQSTGTKQQGVYSGKQNTGTNQQSTNTTQQGADSKQSTNTTQQGADSKQSTYSKQQDSDLNQQSTDVKPQNADVKQQNTDAKKQSSDLERHRTDAKQQSTDVKQQTTVTNEHSIKTHGLSTETIHQSYEHTSGTCLMVKAGSNDPLAGNKLMNIETTEDEIFSGHNDTAKLLEIDKEIFGFSKAGKESGSRKGASNVRGKRNKVHNDPVNTEINNTETVNSDRNGSKVQGRPNELEKENKQNIGEDVNDKSGKEFAECNEGMKPDFSVFEVRRSRRLEGSNLIRRTVKYMEESEDDVEPVVKRKRGERKQGESIKTTKKDSKQFTAKHFETGRAANVFINKTKVKTEMVDDLTIQAENYNEERLKDVKSTVKEQKKKRRGRNVRCVNYVNCSICEMMFPTAVALQLHVAKLHFSEKGLEYECGECSQSFETRDSLRDHRIQKGHVKYLPMRLGELFLDDLDLDNKEHCMVCGKSFLDRKTLRQHCYRTHRHMMPMFECRMCDETYATVTELHEHQRKEKHGYRNFINQQQLCSLCGKTFKTVNTFKEHLLTCAFKNERKFTCDICGMQFHTHSNCLNHRRSVHAQTKIKCKVCGFQLKNIRTLREHTKRLHGEENRKHACTECDKSFFSKTLLLTHMRIHTKEKPFKCALCTYTCSIKQNLPKHAMKRHKDLTMEQCKDYKIVLRDSSSEESSDKPVVSVGRKANSKSIILKNPIGRKDTKYESNRGTELEGMVILSEPLTNFTATPISQQTSVFHGVKIIPSVGNVLSPSQNQLPQTWQNQLLPPSTISNANQNLLNVQGNSLQNVTIPPPSTVVTNGSGTQNLSLTYCPKPTPAISTGIPIGVPLQPLVQQEKVSSGNVVQVLSFVALAPVISVPSNGNMPLSCVSFERNLQVSSVNGINGTNGVTENSNTRLTNKDGFQVDSANDSANNAQQTGSVLGNQNISPANKSQPSCGNTSGAITSVRSDLTGKMPVLFQALKTSLEPSILGNNHANEQKGSRNVQQFGNQDNELAFKEAAIQSSEKDQLNQLSNLDQWLNQHVVQKINQVASVLENNRVKSSSTVSRKIEPSMIGEINSRDELSGKVEPSRRITINSGLATNSREEHNSTVEQVQDQGGVNVSSEDLQLYTEGRLCDIQSEDRVITESTGESELTIYIEENDARN